MNVVWTDEELLDKNISKILVQMIGANNAKIT